MRYHYKYKVCKTIWSTDESEELFTNHYIGTFAKKKSAEEFVHEKDNVEMWKNEYKQDMKISSMAIDIETWCVEKEDMVDAETYLFFD